MEAKIKKAKEMLENESVTFDEFHTYLRDNDIGYWDGVNDEGLIKQYIAEMTEKDIQVSHMLVAIENNSSSKELYEIWLGNSMNTPEPIESKLDLYNALELGEEAQTPEETQSPEDKIAEKAYEMIDNASKFAKELVKKSLTCGALNIEDYDAETYVLPRIIAYTALGTAQFNTRPDSKKEMDESENLSHFI